MMNVDVAWVFERSCFLLQQQVAVYWLSARPGRWEEGQEVTSKTAVAQSDHNDRYGRPPAAFVPKR
jgi:hypothetical protein